MRGNEHFKGKGYAMLQKRDPVKEMKRRQELEGFQVVDRPVILASRHNFQPRLSFSVPQKHDPILAAAQPILGAFSYSTFAGFCNPLGIEPLFSTDAVFLHQAIAYGVPSTAMYAIGRYGFMAKVRLYLNPINCRQVLVQDQESFFDLHDWLQTLPLPTQSITGKAGYRLMLQWWKESGDMFPIMELPWELRTEILKHVLGFDIYPRGVHTDLKNFGFTTYRYSKFGDGSELQRGCGGTLKKIGPPNVGVLTLNKKVYHELRPYVTDQMCKCFQTGENYQIHIRFQTTRALQFRHLRFLELDLSHREYMSFFMVNAVPFHNPNFGLSGNHMYAEATALVHLPALKHLFLRFRAPLNTEDPWGGTGHLNGHSHHEDWRGHTYLHNGHCSWHVSCQRVVVDWILTFALDYVKQIPGITLGGYIKNSTKAKWDKILHDERKGIHHDLSMAKNAIWNWPIDNL